jgi:hypothetical protein
MVQPVVARRYNDSMASPMQHDQRRHHIYALETTGLLIIAATLLGITLVRFWHAIQWSWR